MVPAKLQARSAKNLDGATICVQAGTTTELNLADYFGGCKSNSPRWCSKLSIKRMRPTTVDIAML